MDSGSMNIINHLNQTTTLVIANNIASAVPEDNVLEDASAALKASKESRTVNEGNVNFLTEWIERFEFQERKVSQESTKSIDVATQLQQETNKLAEEIK